MFSYFSSISGKIKGVDHRGSTGSSIEHWKNDMKTLRIKNNFIFLFMIHDFRFMWLIF